jgi:hypothetical protein
LFSTPTPNPVSAIPVQQNQWGQPQQSVQQQQQQQQQQPIQGMIGQAQTNAWGNFSNAVPQQPQQQQGGLSFGTQPASNGGLGGFQQSATLSTTDIWANNNSTTTTTNNQQKDAFDDIWGGFK